MAPKRGARLSERRSPVAIVAALTFRDYGLGWDDYTHAQYGDLLLDLYTSGFTDTRALSFVNLYEYGGGFDMAAQTRPGDLGAGTMAARSRELAAAPPAGWTGVHVMHEK